MITLFPTDNTVVLCLAEMIFKIDSAMAAA